MFYKHARHVLLGRMECDNIIVPDYNNYLHQVQLIFYRRLCNLLYLRHMRHVIAPCYWASFFTDCARGIYHSKDILHEA
jgi:hypothetical protein